MARPCERTDAFGSGADDAEHAPRGVDVGKVVLLDAAECLGGGGVAGEDDEMTTHLEEAVDRLERELVDNLEGACPVRSAGVVA